MEGEYKNDKKYGKMIFFSADGRAEEREYANGERVDWR